LDGKGERGRSGTELVEGNGRAFGESEVETECSRPLDQSVYEELEEGAGLGRVSSRDIRHQVVSVVGDLERREGGADG
jgi:hypothetical protein